MSYRACEWPLGRALLPFGLLVALAGCARSSGATGEHEPVPLAPAPAQQPPASPSEPSTAKAPAERRRYRVAALGDSITDERVGGGGYLRWLRQACPKSSFIDFGKGGDMTNQMHRRFDSDIAPRAREFTTLLLYGGVNDLYSDLTAGRTNDRIEAELLTIYRAARELGLETVAVTVSPWGGFTRYFNPRRSDNTRLLNAWILGQVGSTLDHAVDSYPLLSCGDPEKLCPQYETPRHDGLHPGAEGHALLGQLLHERAFADCE